MSEMICIGCPMGCTLMVNSLNGEWVVEGNQCKIGENYGKEEMTNPTRNVTTSVYVTGGDMALLSVKTAKPVPKAAIMDCIKAVQKITVTAPVHSGEVVLHDAAGTGVDMVATRTVQALQL